MAGKNGSTWHHGWEPTNPAAVDLKMHRAPGAAAPKRPNLAGRFPSREMGDTSPSKKFAGMTAGQIAATAPGPTAKPKAMPSRPARKPAAKPMTAAELGAQLLGQVGAGKPAAPAPAEQQARAAITAAGGTRGGFARVTDVKDRMVGTEADKDRALATMFASGKVNLIPQSNQQALTTAQRKRAVRVGGETKHLISLA